MGAGSSAPTSSSTTAADEEADWEGGQGRRDGQDDECPSADESRCLVIGGFDHVMSIATSCAQTAAMEAAAETHHFSWRAEPPTRQELKTVGRPTRWLLGSAIVHA